MWLPVAMILANVFVAVIPQAKRAFDDEAHGIPGSDFFSSNRGLLKVTAIMTPLGLLIAFIGLVVA